MCVSGAAGAVGSLVGQLSKVKGAKVIGIAGGAQKCGWLKELGYARLDNHPAPHIHAHQPLSDGSRSSCTLAWTITLQDTYERAVTSIPAFPATRFPSLWHVPCHRPNSRFDRVIDYKSEKVHHSTSQNPLRNPLNISCHNAPQNSFYNPLYIPQLTPHRTPI